MHSAIWIVGRQNNTWTLEYDPNILSKKEVFDFLNARIDID